jgi:hypothetical protein
VKFILVLLVLLGMSGCSSYVNTTLYDAQGCAYLVRWNLLEPGTVVLNKLKSSTGEFNATLTRFPQSDKATCAATPTSNK